jgi:drug/metabolite transporter (DMT)-like permease
MMLGGATLTTVSLLSGDARRFSPVEIDVQVGLSMAYLVIAASIVAFTAYVWLLGHEPATRVASYAYVNPVIAVILGWSIGGEKLSPQIVSGMVFVVIGVIAVLRSTPSRTARA